MKMIKVLSLFTKRNKSQKDDIKNKIMTEVMSENKDVVKYQWKKGENFGKVVEVESTDSEFINFTDGSRIFKNVLNEFLEKVQGDKLPLPGADQIAVKLSGEPSIPVPQASPIQDQTNTIASNTSDAVITQPVVASKEPTVMGKMIMKMSKKNVVNVPIQINLNIPTPALYAMLSEGMEAEDLNEEIMEVALSQIEMEKLQDYIKSNVSDFLAEYYS
jgi:hypothetical protein